MRRVLVLAESGLVAVTNTPDDFIERLAPAGRGVRRCGSVKVGLRPVAVASISETANLAELAVSEPRAAEHAARHLFAAAARRHCDLAAR